MMANRTPFGKVGTIATFMRYRSGNAEVSGQATRYPNRDAPLSLFRHSCRTSAQPARLPSDRIPPGETILPPAPPAPTGDAAPSLVEHGDEPIDKDTLTGDRAIQPNWLP